MCQTLNCLKALFIEGIVPKSVRDGGNRWVNVPGKREISQTPTVLTIWEHDLRWVEAIV